MATTQQKGGRKSVRRRRGVERREVGRLGVRQERARSVGGMWHRQDARAGAVSDMRVCVCVCVRVLSN